MFSTGASRHVQSFIELTQLAGSLQSILKRKTFDAVWLNNVNFSAWIRDTMYVEPGIDCTMRETYCFVVCTFDSIFRFLFTVYWERRKNSCIGFTQFALGFSNFTCLAPENCDFVKFCYWNKQPFIALLFPWLLLLSLTPIAWGIWQGCFSQLKIDQLLKSSILVGTWLFLSIGSSKAIIGRSWLTWLSCIFWLF